MAKRKIIDVRRGGVLIPIGNNTYLAKGRTHEQGGIDIGDNLEIENNEVAQLKGDYLKIFSAQPILNGYSPSQLVLGGANPDKVFNAQEKFKEVNKLNDDGSRKKRNGGEEKTDNTYIAPIIGNNLTNNQLKKRIKNDTKEDLDFKFKKVPRAILAGINIFDPTGITNYPNLIRSIKSGNSTDIAFDALGSLPLIKGLALTTKLGKDTRRLSKIERKLNRWIDRDAFQEQINNGYNKLGIDIKNKNINEYEINNRLYLLNHLNNETYRDIKYFDRINNSQQIGRSFIQEDDITEMFKDDNKRCGGKKQYGDRMKYIKNMLRY